ncbi:MAG: HD-GYP domain-containing protein [Acidobacteria bacterium]|nr:HD-GYP domain-containing protein [Acidobacteriota bacterium]
MSTLVAETDRRQELVRRLAAATRGTSLYSPAHPMMQRSIANLMALCTETLQNRDHVTIGFLGDDVVVDDAKLSNAAASLVGFVRHLRDRQVEKIRFARGLKADELRAFITELAAAPGTRPLDSRLAARGVRNVTVGQITVTDNDPAIGIAAAQRLYRAALDMAESLWDAAKAGEKPDPAVARKIIDSLAGTISHDRSALMALTALKKYDNYTFTHMVNVSVLAMALARSLNIDGPLLREFGFAALMHDIGKVQTPSEILTKVDMLTKEEFDVMKRHVVDGAHILRKTPEMPALAPVVAFEHHLKQDLSGYPENIGHRQLNLGTMIVSIADVYDALRSNRVYREGLSSDRVRSIMQQQTSPAFNQKLLRRFVNLIGLFPIGTLVRLSTHEVAVVVREHPLDPFRPQVKIVLDRGGDPLENPVLVNTWDRDDRGEHPYAVLEAVDPDTVTIDPLAFLQDDEPEPASKS